MRKRLLKVGVIALAMLMPTSAAWADKYVIYPVPRSITMNSGTLAMTPKVNVVCENTIDGITKKRLTNLLAEHGIETLFDGGDAANVTVRLGTVGSGGEVETLAFGDLGLTKSKVMVSKKFDRHAIKVSAEGITIIGENTNAVFYGLASLEQMMEQQVDGALEYTVIYDRADQQNRGLVEGYYGYPYSVEVKKDLMRYMMRFKMNTYMYGAKSDPYHSQMWRDAYPVSISEEQERNGWLTQDMVREIAEVSEETKVNFIWAIHPGNEFVGSSTVISDIMSKFELMHELGVRHFGVFVDDVGIPSTDADMKTNADRLTGLQKAIEERWNTDMAAPEDTVRPLHFVPQIYCNSFASSEDQRKRFMSALSKVPSYITVYSTGQGVWSVPNNSHTATVVNEFGRPMGWWWNYPCNDNADGQLYPMDMYSNFVDMPSVGDGERLPTILNNCQGIVANPMQQGEVAKTSLFSIADYAWNNQGFKNETSWKASFRTIIEDEEVREAYRSITYYLRWNDPQSMQSLINSYKSSLESGTPNSAALLKEILDIKANCEKVITLRDSEIKSDRLLYTDIAPWLHTLHTYTIVVEKMLGILDNPEAHNENWLAVKEVSDSLYSLDNNTLYTAYALEGMGNGISVSKRQAQLSRKYLHPFVYYLKEKAVAHYFDDPTAITEPTAISNSLLLNAKVNVAGGIVSLDMAASDLDVKKYVGVALPAPVLIDKIVIDEAMLPLARYSSDGKVWNKLESTDDLLQKHVGYFIFMNETGKGIKEFALSESNFSITTATQSVPVGVTIPDGGIYDNHTKELMVDGNYNTYTCLNRNQQSGDAYVLDLGAEVAIYDVRLCMGTVNGDHPNGARMEYSVDGKQWKALRIMGTSATTNWSISAKQNVKYSNEMVYCDFDAAGKEGRYVRLRLSSPNTSKWMRLYEIEVNRQHGENGTLPECSDGNGGFIEQVTDANALTGIPASTAAPLTYSFNRIYDVEGVTFYSLPSSQQPTISVTTDNEEWTGIGALTDVCQWVDLKDYPKARAIRIEWQGSEAPAIYEVMPKYNMATSSLPNESNELADAFALLKSKALHALDSCGQGDKLVTKNDQFSSPYTESSEGSINNLLDRNQNTFWHSAWSAGDVADGVHYIEISLPAETVGDVIMHFGRRSNTDGHHLTKARILGVVSGSGTSATTEEVAEFDMPYSSQKETVVKRFTLSKAYPSIRLQEVATTGGAGFFHIGELQFYATENYYIIKDAQAEADALVAAAAPIPSEATEEDLDKLQAAYDAFMYKVFGVVPSGISGVYGDDNGNGIYYDLSGRRAVKPMQGKIYIVDGKKVMMDK